MSEIYQLLFAAGQFPSILESAKYKESWNRDSISNAFKYAHASSILLVSFEKAGRLHDLDVCIKQANISISTLENSYEMLLESFLTNYGLTDKILKLVLQIAKDYIWEDDLSKMVTKIKLRISILESNALCTNEMKLMSYVILQKLLQNPETTIEILEESKANIEIRLYILFNKDYTCENMQIVQAKLLEWFLDICLPNKAKELFTEVFKQEPENAVYFCKNSLYFFEEFISFLKNLPNRKFDVKQIISHLEAIIELGNHVYAEAVVDLVHDCSRKKRIVEFCCMSF